MEPGGVCAKYLMQVNMADHKDETKNADISAEVEC